MLDTLSFSVNAILPLVLLILLGYGVRRLGFFSEDALKQLNRFNFRVPFCALMFVNIYNMDLSRGIPVPVRLVGLVVLAIVILTVLGLVLAQVLTKERARKGVLVQAMFRSNSAIIGLPLSESVAGAAGLATATVFQLPVVIYFNAMSVVMLSLYSRSEEKPKAGKVFAGVLKNPLIQGLLAGALALVIRQFIPVGADGLPVFSIRYSLPWLYQALSYVSRVATPLALIVLGAQMRFSDASLFRRELISGVIMRLVGAPVVGFGLLLLAARTGFITLSPAVVGGLIGVFASPLSVSAMVMAAQMDADDKLAGQIVAWSSIMGMLSLFVIITVFRAMGLL